MFDRESWIEIFSTIQKNKMRTFLTGFAISWGIFMFCILLSAGNGLRNGMLKQFGSRSVNSVQYWGRWMSVPYEGLPKNRRIDLDEDKDVPLLKHKVPEADEIVPIMDVGLTAGYETFSTACGFTGVTPEYMRINGIKIKDGQGRWLNDLDMREKRKVAVINARLREVLFKDENPVGKKFQYGGGASYISYTVIGVFEEKTWGNNAKAYIPYTTGKTLYDRGSRSPGDIAFTIKGLDTEEANKQFEERFREQLAKVHRYDPKDKRAIGMWNQLQNYLQFIGIFNGLSAFIWIIGIGTLIAGIIGVSNIMLITVKERTREIGIRKALGAKPRAILSGILLESVFITSVFGYLGMFLGVGLGELVSGVLENIPESPIQSPTIDVSVAVGAMLVLVFSGLVAGYFPAWKAVSVSPVEAMRNE
ncbi:ABC transporter permease [Candidatus Symbiothrix dinenymphae]|uniref:ABC transporter permease n=1 Tax=Candidatus Symbiothrix dinenymphae TaxID=467085 RepID=UPI0006BFD40D|nr:ABC transporter permease [Candidatus Symbiothrix dinenymphae]GAP72025.1 ABC transporter permease protein [Candidatus Symbiothrix dinenymphae]